MRRLPIYFLIDVSESMAGQPLQQVQQGMRDVIQELRSDPYALETAYVSVLAFAGRPAVLSPLTELFRFYPPVFPIGGGTALGSALTYLMDEMKRTLVPTTRDSKGDWKPTVFLFTDGNPTDDPHPALDRWKREFGHRAFLVVVAIGDSCDTSLFDGVAESVLRFNPTEPASYKSFFRWVTASIRSASQSVDMGLGDAAGERLAPLPSGIDLRKADDLPAASRDGKADDSYCVLVAKCQTTRHRYLNKFSRRSTSIPGAEMFSTNDYKLVGSYPIDDEDAYDRMCDPDQPERSVNTTELVGMPACPCCGNQLGVVICACGKMFCGDPEKPTQLCPWCGLPGSLGYLGAEGANVGRAMG